MRTRVPIFWMEPSATMSTSSSRAICDHSVSPLEYLMTVLVGRTTRPGEEPRRLATASASATERNWSSGDGTRNWNGTTAMDLRPVARGVGASVADGTEGDLRGGR